MRPSIEKSFSVATLLLCGVLCAACSSGSGSDGAPPAKNAAPVASVDGEPVVANPDPSGPDAVDAPTSAASATPEKPATPATTVDVEIEPRKLDVDEKKRVVRYNLDGGRMTHKYRVYQFQYDDYVKAIGGADKVKTAVKLRVELRSQTADVYDSTNPQEAKPLGGIETQTWAARVVEVLP